MTRNDPLRFAALTWKNLEFIEQAAHHNPDVHAITQLALSLLGLIVLQHQNHAKFDNKLRATKLADLNWPCWEPPPPGHKTGTLGGLIERLRHVIAHGGITFSSDGADPHETMLIFHDTKAKWRGTISAADLREFCYRFKTFLEEHS